MDNPVHVEIQVIKLLIVGIRSSCVDWNNLSVNLSGMLFNNRSWRVEMLACDQSLQRVTK